MEAPRVLVIAVLWPLIPGASVAAQRIVTGQVVSADAPVSWANIHYGARRVVADDSGAFRLTLGPGKVSLWAKRIGYQAVALELAAGGDTSITIEMVPLARMLAKQVVEATAITRSLELSGFHRRLQERQRGTNAGQFITAEEIEQRKPTRTTQLFDGRTGIKVTRFNTSRFSSEVPCGGPTGLVCWVPQGLGGCNMTVYYDGKRMRPYNGIGARDTPTFVDELVLPNDIAGIEIYTTPGKAPAEYQSLSGTCGVILIWSR